MYPRPSKHAWGEPWRGLARLSARGEVIPGVAGRREREGLWGANAIVAGDWLPAFQKGISSSEISGPPLGGVLAPPYESSAGAGWLSKSSPPERAPAPPPALAAAAPSARPPSMRKLLATISKLVRFWPSLSCHSRDWILPSIKMSEPFFKYCCAISACLPHTTILCHSVRFCRSPALSLYVSSVATEKFATAWPPPVYRVSGSRPRRPTRITLFTDMSTLPEPVKITRGEQ